jgi:hypothetical protein
VCAFYAQFLLDVLHKPLLSLLTLLTLLKHVHTQVCVLHAQFLLDVLHKPLLARRALLLAELRNPVCLCNPNNPINSANSISLLILGFE